MTITPVTITGFTRTSTYQVLRWLSGVYILLAIVVYIAAIVPRFAFLIDQIGLPQSLAILQLIEEYILVTVTSVIGVFLLWRSTRDRMLMLTALSFIIGLGNLSALSTYAPRTHPLLWIPATLVFFGTPISTHLWYVTFPDGRTLPVWARWWVLVIFAWEALRYVVFFVQPGPQEIALRPFATTVTAALLLPSFFTIMQRFRHLTSPTQRQQFKWIAAGLVVAPPMVILFVLRGIVRMQSDMDVIVAVEFLAATTMTISSICFCIAIAFAVLRRGLWNVDLTLNRSIVTGVVLLILMLVFGAIFIVTQAAMRTLLGAGAGEIAVAAAALVIGVLFNPVRQRVRHFVDRRVFGLRFDLDQLERAQHAPDIQNAGAHTGKTLGGYKLLGVLGRGGMGEVYKASTADGKIAAIKILHEYLIEDHTLRQRFIREGHITLSHPNIVETYAYGESNGIFFIVMEYVEGETLRDVIKQRERLSLADVRAFLPDFAAALDTAHAQGYVHRDITPGNIMLRRRTDNEHYAALLMDFGIAKLLDDSTLITGSGAIGTIDYMSPEQIMRAHSVDHRADLYALGSVLYEALTGKKLFDGSAGQVLFSHIQEPAPDAREYVPELPDHVGTALLKALAKTPEDRFQSAQELTEALLS